MSSYLAEDGTAGPPARAGRSRGIPRAVPQTGLHEAYGTVQKEYVDVPADLLATTDGLAPWFAASVTYVAGLRPKPSKRSTG